MDLQDVVNAYAAGIEFADTGATTSSGKAYLPGLATLDEDKTLDAIVENWRVTFPGHFTSPNHHSVRSVKYAIPGRTTKCDHVFTTDGSSATAEWAVEFKRIIFFGDNGKRNDFGTAKVVSPFLKDRGVLHDASRLHEHPPARRLAVLLYAFEYDLQWAAEARRRHPGDSLRIDEVEQVLVKANDGEPLGPRPLAKIADYLLRGRDWLVGDSCEQTFEAWRHPCGGPGRVIGWEIVNPSAAPKSAVHPW